jgi:amino acid transporter
MGLNGNKFGAFKGVFTPSILTILGVIMYLRLPWIVGEAGLWATLGIIIVAHIISGTTGLSVASIATDKKVETGGTYYMISRSLGLPIGGTLGLALFVGLSFSVSLYIIGFSETLLNAFGFEVTLNTIRLTGAITLFAVTVVTFISTSLALKTQFIILAVLTLSIISIAFGKHDLAPTAPLLGSSVNSVPWIALFAIFFPAVTGFEAGVSMSGDLANPKKSIPLGTISAIVVGLVVYIGLALFFSYTVDRNALTNDPAVLLNISLYSPLVVAGIWGATLSSAFGSILGAPRILQATAIDRITPKFFAKGVGAGNEPRNAIILTFFIALVGIMIGELNVIARVVSIFFIITYGFLNLTCAIENWAGSDFRPSFRIPAWVSIIGAIACFVVMIQLDIAAMIGATVLLGAVFFLLKRKELKLQSGDTWGGFWSSLVKYGLIKLSASVSKNQRNWRPNIILFSGSAKARPHLIDMGRMLVGKQGVFTNFELVENPDDKLLFEKSATAITEVDHNGINVITRKHSCKNIYDGMRMIARVYGFTGFEPNTILMGWAKKSNDPKKFEETTQALHKLDYNLVFLNQVNNLEASKNKRIDIWWNGNSRNLNFGIALLKYITTDNHWRRSNIRVLVINYNNAKTDSIYSLVNQVLDNSRLIGTVKVINNATEKLSEIDIIKRESADACMAILELNALPQSNSKQLSTSINQATDLPCSSLIIEAGSGFENINAFTIPQEISEGDIKSDVPSVPLVEKIRFPAKELLAEETQKITIQHDSLQRDLVNNSIVFAESQLNNYHTEVTAITKKVFVSLEKNIQNTNKTEINNSISRTLSDFIFLTKTKLSQFNDSVLTSAQLGLKDAYNTYHEKIDNHLKGLPEKLTVKFFKDDFTVKRKDSASIKLFKFKSKIRGLLAGWPLNQRIDLAKASELFLHQNRLETFYDFYLDFGLSSFRFVSNIRRCLVDFSKGIEQLNTCPNTDETIIKLEALKVHINELLAETIHDFRTSNLRATKNLNSDLEASLQRLCFVVGKPESNYLLTPYSKIVKKKNRTNYDIEKMPEIWHTNIKLFANKSLLEFILISLKHRLNIKLRKQVDELTRWTNGKLLETTKDIKTVLRDLKTSQKLPDTSNIHLKIGNLKDSGMQERFEVLFKDINEIINDLPEKIEVNNDLFFTELEKGNFPESDIRQIDIRHKAQFYIGTELISNARTSMEVLSESLKEIATRLGDKLRLASFNIENLLIQSEANEANRISEELKDKLVEDLLQEIAGEEHKIQTILNGFDQDLNKYLNSSLEPLHQLVFTKASDSKSSRIRSKSSAHFKIIGKTSKQVKSFVNRQIVRLLYSKSEGIMLAQKLTNFEKEYRISNQSIQEMLVGLSGQKKVLKDLPFYYTSLFSGSTTISKDLWVDRTHEQSEAETIISRFKSGYSGALLITGNRNTGKTTLSKYIAKAYLPKYEISLIKPLKGGSIKREEFEIALQKGLNTDSDPFQFLSSSPAQRVIIINDLELWWERHEGGLDVIASIVNLIESYSSKIFFIVNCNTLSYQLINRITNLDPNFMGNIECKPFDARELKELVFKRHRTGGLKIQLKGKTEESLTEWNYAQLFNNYFNLSSGNPGYTLQSWLSNITNVAGKSVYIKHPVSPNLSHLNGVSNELWLVILQMILHRRCTIERLARVLRQSESQTKSLITEMQRAGLVEERFPNTYAVNALLEPHLLKKMEEKGFC